MPRISPALSRRNFIQTGIAGATLFSPVPWAWVWAQTPQGPQLQRLPKVALIIGNSKYKEAPLKNPANDAKAIGESLTGLGFEVTLHLDTPKAAMDTAITAYVNTLATRKCVGLFYYAGHGIQLAWKNYLLPVDANIDVIGDVAKQSFELDSLIVGLTKASNPMNVIMLDACRDNPFGEAKQPEQKGLSQMDAPHSTILAYATAPGNTASDGEGANGLYTENLLREIKVKEAKIEDIFKRIRLNVRRTSKGAQIPWESTSLEDDFYFIPPGNLASPKDEERAKAFAAELKLWESIEASNEIAPFEDYLKRFPSGQFSELAQLRFDLLLKKQGEKAVQIVSSKGNPFTRGTAFADIAFKVGDTFGYRVSDIASGAQKQKVVATVTQITDREVIYNNGQTATDLLGNITKQADGRRPSGSQNQPTEYELGKRWVTRFLLAQADGRMFDNELSWHVVAKEPVTVPAGTFECYRVEGKGKARGPGLMPGIHVDVQLDFKYWMAPEVCRRAIKRENIRVVFVRGNRQVVENDRYELESFKQG